MKKKLIMLLLGSFFVEANFLTAIGVSHAFATTSHLLQASYYQNVDSSFRVPAANISQCTQGLVDGYICDHHF